jgi:hypothetical protein
MTAEGDFINQSIVARELGLSVPDALARLAAKGYWDAASRRPTASTLADGLAKVIEHPLTGTVTMWAPQIMELVTGAPKLPAVDTEALAIAPLPAVAAPADPAPVPSGDRTIEIFIASSIEEFGTERPQIAGILHSVDRQFLVYLAEYDPDGDSQEAINRHLASAEYFVAIIGRRLGQKTRLEIDLALQRFRQHGTPRVKFFIQKFADNHAQRSSDVEDFARELFEDGVHYPREFADQQELIDQVELFFRRLKK